MDEVPIADSLVHEAIHSFIYVVEEEQPFIPDRAAAETVKLISPWSGRALELHAFLHACFVWFGMWQFWRRALGSGVFPEARARRWMARSRAGFDHPSLLDDLHGVSAHVSQATRAVLFDLVQAVRGGGHD